MVSCQVTLSKIVQANILSLAHATIDRFRKCCKGTVHGLTTMYFWCGPSPPWKATSFICSHPALHCLQCLLIKWEGPGIFLHMRMTLSENGNSLQNEQALFHRPSYLSTSPIHTHTPSPGTVSDDMADAIVNFKQSTEYKCDKLGYLSTPVGKVRIHCSKVYRRICNNSYKINFCCTHWLEYVYYRIFWGGISNKDLYTKQVTSFQGTTNCTISPSYQTPIPLSHQRTRCKL